MSEFVSRAGQKLEHALTSFNVDVSGKVCADFGSSTGGFVDCLLQHGATKVYSVDTSYGELDWKLRNDPRVVVMERKNAMHVILAEKVELITVDTGWTRQEKVLPNVIKNLAEGGKIISLFKPHYEKGKGTVSAEDLVKILSDFESSVNGLGLKILNKTESPIEGARGGNKEFLYLLVNISV